METPSCKGKKVTTPECRLIVVVLQVRIQDLITGGPRSGAMKFADVAKRNHVSEASPIVARGPGPTQGPQKQ